MVLEAHLDTMLQAAVDANKQEVQARISGKMGKNFKHFLPGDKVLMELPPNDLNLGRVT